MRIESHLKRGGLVSLVLAAACGGTAEGDPSAVAAPAEAPQSVDLAQETRQVETIGCTAEQNAELLRIGGVMDRWVSDQYMGMWLHIPAERAHNARYAYWFGEYTEADFHDVAMNYVEQIRIKFFRTNTGTNAVFVCDDSALGFVENASPFRIHIGTGFWNAPLIGPSSQVGYLVRWLAAHPNIGRATEYNDDPEAAAARAGRDSYQAVRNAASYQYFIENDPWKSTAEDSEVAQSGIYLVHLDSDYCLDVDGAPATGDASQIHLSECEFSGRSSNGATTDQRWTLTEHGFLRNELSGKCLDVDGTPATIAGSNILLAACEYDGRSPNGKVTDQRWAWHPRLSRLVHLQSGRCLGSAGNNLHDHLQLVDCDMTDASTQRWQVSQGEKPLMIQAALTGQCIDVTGAPGTKNDLVHLWDCEMNGRGSNGSLSDQYWVLTGDGFLKNAASPNYCLDAIGDPGDRAGAELHLWDCEYRKMNTDQRWEITNGGYLRNVRYPNRCLASLPKAQRGDNLHMAPCLFGHGLWSNDRTDQVWIATQRTLP